MDEEKKYALADDDPAEDTGSETQREEPVLLAADDDALTAEPVDLEADTGPCEDDGTMDVQMLGPEADGEESEKDAPLPAIIQRFGFFQRIALHLVLMIALSGFVSLVVTYIQIRGVLIEDAETRADAMFESVSAVVRSHYTEATGLLNTSGMLDEINRRFLNPVHQARQVVPLRMVITDIDGLNLVSHGTERFKTSRENTPIDSNHPDFQLRYDSATQLIHLEQMIFNQDEPLAYLQMTVPTRVREKLFSISWRLSASIFISVLFVVLISHLFAKHELKPIKALTQAAHKVHLGTETESVDIRRMDEIGELTTTFNQMVESLSRRINLLQFMQDAVVRIGREIDYDKLNRTLSQIFQDISSAPACRLYLYNQETKKLEVGSDSGSLDLPPPEEDEAAHRAFEERWAQFVKANGHLGARKEEAHELAIPLLSGKERVGVIRIGPNEKNEPFDGETLTILNTMAQFASVTLENAVLYSELSSKQRIEQEMKWARNIQQAMLPETIPEIEGFSIAGSSLPAYEVGGDYYDFVSAGGRLYIIIADVSGKGVPAALIMSNMRSLIHTYLQYESRPQEMLSLVNRSLSADLEQDMFVTLSILCLEPEQGTIHFARAGHEPLIILRNDGTIGHYSPKGPAMGLLTPAIFERLIEDKAISLQDGDLLLAFTDGATEAQNPDGEEFGLSRIEQLLKDNADLPVSEIQQRIQGAIKAFTQGGLQQDDITILVCRKTPSFQEKTV